MTDVTVPLLSSGGSASEHLPDQTCQHQDLVPMSHVDSTSREEQDHTQIQNLQQYENQQKINVQSSTSNFISRSTNSSSHANLDKSVLNFATSTGKLRESNFIPHENLNLETSFEYNKSASFRGSSAETSDLVNLAFDQSNHSKPVAEENHEATQDHQTSLTYIDDASHNLIISNTLPVSSVSSSFASSSSANSLSLIDIEEPEIPDRLSGNLQPLLPDLRKEQGPIVNVNDISNILVASGTDLTTSVSYDYEKKDQSKDLDLFQTRQSTNECLTAVANVVATSTHPAPPAQVLSNALPPVEQLQRACISGDLSVVDYVIRFGLADANTRDMQNCTPLQWAAINSHFHIVKYLLNHGADINAKGGDLMGTALHWALRQGLLHMAIYLLQQNADPLLADNAGFNPLHLAVHSASATSPLLLLYLLVMTDVNPNSFDSDLQTPLMWAAYQGSESLPSLRILLKFGSNPNIRDKNGMNALDWALMRGNIEAADELILYGASLNNQTDNLNHHLQSRGVAPVGLEETVKKAVDSGGKHIGAWYKKWLRARRNSIFGNPKEGTLFNQKVTYSIFAFMPFLHMFTIITLLSYLNWQMGILAFFGSTFALQLLFRLLVGGNFQRMHTMPYLVNQIPRT